MNVLSTKETAKKVNLSRVTIWRLERDGDFPQRISLSENKRGFIESELDEWILSRTRGIGSQSSKFKNNKNNSN